MFRQIQVSRKDCGIITVFNIHCVASITVCEPWCCHVGSAVKCREISQSVVSKQAKYLKSVSKTVKKVSICCYA